jgi:hypothetical protein
LFSVFWLIAAGRGWGAQAQLCLRGVGLGRMLTQGRGVRDVIDTAVRIKSILGLFVVVYAIIIYLYASAAQDLFAGVLPPKFKVWLMYLRCPVAVMYYSNHRYTKKSNCLQVLSNTVYFWLVALFCYWCLLWLFVVLL